MRVIVAAAVLVAGVVSPARSARAAGERCTPTHAVDPQSGEYVTRVTCRGREARHDGAAATGSTHLEPNMRQDAELGACIYRVARPGPPDPRANDLGVLDAILAVVPPCAGADLGPPRPVTVATEMWARTRLPRPAPATSPPEPVTGLDAYLIVGAPLRRTATHATPLGTLTIRATGEATILWGDGTTATAAPGDEGGPYPSGRIRHVYVQRGPTVLSVTIAWRATWSLAGRSGRLPVLRTSASAALTVREIQAVVTG